MLDDAVEAFVAPQLTEPYPQQQAADAYVGTYHDPHELGRVEVTAQGQSLTAAFPDLGFTSPLEHLGGDSFYVDLQHIGGEVAARFWAGADGRLQYFASVYGVASR